MSIPSKIDPKLLQDILGYDELFTAGYTRLDILADMRTVADVEGFESLSKKLLSRSANSRLGHLYELQAASHLKTNGLAVNMQFLEKLVRANPDGTGRVLTDIDIVADGVYYQVKVSESAFRSLDATKSWVLKAQADALSSGINPPVIKYIVPSNSAVPQNIQDFFIDEGIEWITAPLLQ